MHHVAILDRKRKLLDKILSGEKTIESRWYKHRRAPWNAISKGDTIYFKDCGEPITAKAAVKNVLFFDNLDKDKVLMILHRYGRAICLEILDYTPYYDGRNYCILLFLENVKKIKPFNIDKTGFGNANAWITVENIDKIKSNN